MNDASGYGGAGGFGGGFGVHSMGGRAGMGLPQGSQMPTAFSTLRGTGGGLGMPGGGQGQGQGQGLGGGANVGGGAGGSNGGSTSGLGAAQQRDGMYGQQSGGGQGRQVATDSSPYPTGDILSMVGNKGQGNVAGQRIGSMPMGGLDSSRAFGVGDLGVHGIGGAGGGSGGAGVGGGVAGGLGGGGGGGMNHQRNAQNSVTFDMKEFPALGAGMANLNLNLGGAGGTEEAYSRQAYRVEQQHQGFSMQSHDFPALPVASPSSQVGGVGQGGNSSQASPSPLGRASFHPSNGNSDGLGQNMSSTASSSRPGAPGQASPQLLGPGLACAPTAAAVVVARKKYGLLGLLGVIRMTDPDLNMLALGSDLTTLGLNLDSSEVLYGTFASPWAESPAPREPQFQLPSCYFIQPPPLKPNNLRGFHVETLFYMFYAMPQDALQAYAAQELYNREWRFHADLKVWFKRTTQADSNVPPGVQFIYFDHNNWEKQVVTGNIQVAAGLMSEEEVLVK